MESEIRIPPQFRPWTVILRILAIALIVYEGLTGLALYYVPMGSDITSEVLLHSGLGILLILPLSAFLVFHWSTHRTSGNMPIRLLGYVGMLGVAGILVSGPILTVRVLSGILEHSWINVLHLYSVVLFLTGASIHLLLQNLHKKHSRNE